MKNRTMLSDRKGPGPYARLRRLFLGACSIGMIASASAQGIYPGDPDNEAQALPGGFEPVLHLRTYYLDQESLTGAPSAAWLPNRNETNVRVDYAFGKGTILEGLVATFRYS